MSGAEPDGTRITGELCRYIAAALGREPPAAVAAKARELMAPVLGKSQADGLIVAVRAIEKLEDARDLRRWLAA